MFALQHKSYSSSVSSVAYSLLHELTVSVPVTFMSIFKQ